MGNLFEYLAWRDDLTLASSPFNEVDGVILARLAYFPLELIGMGEGDRLSVGAAAAALLSVPELRERAHLAEQDEQLLHGLMRSARYRDMELFFYRNVFSPEREAQFCAVSVRLDDGLTCAAFRGTDLSVVGWKENFNMAFECPVASQQLAADYVAELAGKTRGRMILAGHSKGGNLAIYGGAFCGQPAQERIDAVYSYDGPGFLEKTLASEEYRRIRPRSRTFLPQSSVVGMLFDHEEECVIVHSTGAGFAQHNIYTWQTRRAGFEYLDALTEGSLFIDSVFRDSLQSMDARQREIFVDAVFGAIAETNVETMSEFGENWRQNVGTVLRSVMGSDWQTRLTAVESTTAIMRSARDEIARRMEKRFREAEAQPDGDDQA